jgi:hypothetical protein
MSARSPEKAQFYDDILVTLFDGVYGAIEQFGLGYVLVVMPSRDVYNNLVFGADGYVDFKYSDEPEITHHVTADTIAHAFTVMHQNEHINYLHDNSRARYLRAYRENEAGDIDAVDATNILEIALFGEVVYG